MQKIAEELLNRRLVPRDGIAKTVIETAEKRLGFALPQALRSFYLKLGNHQGFSQSFNRYLMPDALAIEHGKLIFLAENQHVCFWAVDVNEIPNKNIKKQSLTVYQTQHDGEFFSEEVDLAEFIRLNLYYQLAQGGYTFCASLETEEKQQVAQLFAELASNGAWQKVVAHNHLVIFANNCQLIWYFTNEDNEPDETIFASTLYKKDLNALIKQYRFSDLG